MRYLAEDGKIFLDECECSAYERELKERKEQQLKELEMLDKLKKEYDSAKERFYLALDEYNAKYREYNKPEIIRLFI